MMSTPTTVHGGLPPNIRDHHGVFGEKSDPTPQERLASALARVAELKRKHAEAQSSLRAAVEDDSGHYDFRALKSDVHRLAGDLETAEQDVKDWTAGCALMKRADDERRFDAALKQARDARKAFEESFRECCLNLGKWCALGGEVRNLVNALASRLPNGTVYYLPELKAAWAEVD